MDIIPIILAVFASGLLLGFVFSPQRRLAEARLQMERNLRTLNNERLEAELNLKDQLLKIQVHRVEAAEGLLQDLKDRGVPLV